MVGFGIEFFSDSFCTLVPIVLFSMIAFLMESLFQFFFGLGLYFLGIISLTLQLAHSSV